MNSDVSLKNLLAPHFWTIFNNLKLHNVIYGGRGSTKTSMIAINIVYSCISDDDCSAVILRRHQNLLRNSVYKEIKRACKRLGLIEGTDYQAGVSPMQIKFKENGNTIYFASGDDYEAVKGMIDENKTIKKVWFEELTGWDDIDQIDQIIATFTRGNNSYFNAFYSYNPPKNKYHVINEWANEKKKDENYLFSESDYRTVPKEWLGNIFINEAERMKKYDNKRYRWIYLGEVIGIEGLIYNPELFTKVDEDYIDKNGLRILYVDFSIDSGHQTSATACGAFGYASDGNWYLLDTYYYSPQEKPRKKAPSELSNDLFRFRNYILVKYKTLGDKETIDSAEGALRNQYYKDYGVRLSPVNKGTNKEELVDYSQDFLASGKFRVVDNNNNKIFLKETKEYAWEKESVQKGKPTPDKSEHELKNIDTYFNSHSKEISYYYADHTCDMFQYWVKDNLQKLNLKF